MSSWIQRVGALFGGRAAASVVATSRSRSRASAPVRTRTMVTAAPSTQPPDTDASVFAESVIPDPQLPFFEWLLGTSASLDAPLLPNEHRLLARLDAVLAADASRNELLPRAPAVIPQLMNSLRDESQSAQALADRVAKDPNLVAEVIRLANSTLTRAAEPVSDLPQAILRLGTQGLRRAIAKVVLKPIFDAQANSLSGRAAPRLWLHSEAKAAECMKLAAAAGLDPFEGYLAGLMHNIGWTAALRALDRAGKVEGGAPPQFSRAFVQAFEGRREMFFAMLVMPWQLTDSLTALAVELLDGGLSASTSKLGQALLAADRNASLDMLGAGAPGRRSTR
ncbi:MAG: HDOD domain-containing protein [Burkholderiales bacterium]